MKLLNILQGIEFNILQGDSNIEINNIQYDSRKISKNDVFICICGLESDGHRFIYEVIERGANTIICEKDINTENIQKDITVLRVEDGRKALAIMASNYYGNPAEKLNIIGITGTNGKTTSAFMLKTVLERAGIKTGLIGTVANYIGDKEIPSERTTPASLELHKFFKDMVNEGCTYCVMEVSSHSLDLDRVYGINFNVSIFTNITRDHMDYHKTFDNYYSAKYKLFEASKLSIVNIDDDYGNRIINDLKSKGKKYLTFSSKVPADFIISSIEPKGLSSRFNVNNCTYKLLLPGEYNIQNATGVIACAISIRIQEEAVKEGLISSSIPGRCERVGLKYNLPYEIIIDYAHTPDGLYKVLETLKETTNNRLIALYGSGGDREREKRVELGKVGKELADIVILGSDNPKDEKPIDILNEIAIGLDEHDYKIIEDREEAIKYAISIAKEGDTILLAGKGHEEYQIINGEYVYFSEKNVLDNLFDN